AAMGFATVFASPARRVPTVGQSPGRSVVVVLVALGRIDAALLGDLLAQAQLFHLGLQAPPRDAELASRAGHVRVGLGQRLADQRLLDAPRSGLDGFFEIEAEAVERQPDRPRQP